MKPYKFLLALALTFTGLVVAYGGGNPPTDDAPLAVPKYNTVDILTPEQQIARIDALNASEDALLAEYDTYPYYEEDHLPATFAPDAFSSYKCGVWFPLAISQGWPDNPIILKTLDRICWRESRGIPDADSGPDHGLMQINKIHTKWINDLGWTFEDMKDPTANLRFAWLLYSGREANGQCGWTPWAIKC
jgi:hypothetical protein